MNTGPREWDAETYDAISDPQFTWGMEVLERLELAGDEVVLNAGCGSGRVTAELVKRLPRGRVIAVDGSEAMVAKARAMGRIADAADRFGVGWREAGQAVAIARVAEAARLRSVYP